MARRIERILVIKLSALGDFVLALAAMKKIRQAHPKAHITLLTTPPFEALAKICPYFNAVDTGGKPLGFAGWMTLRQRIRAVAMTASTIFRPRPGPTGSSRCCDHGRQPGPASPLAARCRTRTRCGTACTRWSARPTS